MCPSPGPAALSSRPRGAANTVGGGALTSPAPPRKARAGLFFWGEKVLGGCRGSVLRGEGVRLPRRCPRAAPAAPASPARRRPSGGSHLVSLSSRSLTAAPLQPGGGMSAASLLPPSPPPPPPLLPSFLLLLPPPLPSFLLLLLLLSPPTRSPPPFPTQWHRPPAPCAAQERGHEGDTGGVACAGDA